MRVLITTVTAGAGNLEAAAALDEAWRAFRPEDVVDRIDLLKFFSPLHRKIHADGYVKLVEHAPEVWGMLFKTTDNPALARRMNRLKQLFPSNSRAKFARYVKQFKPDVVLCTHYLPLEMLARLKTRNTGDVAATGKGAAKNSKRSANEGVGTTSGTGLLALCPEGRSACLDRPFVVSVVTDFEAHALWMEPCVDLYCVAAEETKARLVARGAAARNVVATGIPISARDRKSTRLNSSHT